MNAENLIIEDFDFARYEIVRIYPLGKKTVIQIGEASYETPRKALLDEIDDLKHDCKIFEEEKESAESELEKAEKELNDLEDKHEEYLHKIDCAIESAEFNLKIDTSSRHSYDRISEIAAKVSQQFESLEEEREHFKEIIRGLEVDNNALCDTITRQDERIIELEKLLAAQEN